MGYEVKLIIGESTGALKELKRTKEPVIDNDEIYYAYEKDRKGDFIPTGRKEIGFLTIAEIDLCKCAYGKFGELVEVSDKSAKKSDPNIVHKWYAGNIQQEVDCYDARKIPVPLSKVIAAIQKDVDAGDDYRRFAWALALLKSIQETSKDEYSVILYGH